MTCPDCRRLLPGPRHRTDPPPPSWASGAPSRRVIAAIAKSLRIHSTSNSKLKRPLSLFCTGCPSAATGPRPSRSRRPLLPIQSCRPGETKLLRERLNQSAMHIQLTILVRCPASEGPIGQQKSVCQNRRLDTFICLRFRRRSKEPANQLSARQLCPARMFRRAPGPRSPPVWSGRKRANAAPMKAPRTGAH